MNIDVPVLAMAQKNAKSAENPKIPKNYNKIKEFMNLC